MDCDMPVMDGLEATRRLRELMKRGELPTMKIVACTAFAFQHELDKCVEAGMDQCITKPVNTAQVEAILRSSVFGS
jgi:CheY-like chemotaxis protein